MDDPALDPVSHFQALGGLARINAWSSSADIVWALVAGLRVAPLALEGIRSWRPDLATQWTQFYTRGIRRRQNLCRAVTRIAQNNALAGIALRTLAWRPSLAASYIRTMNAPIA